jgi:6-phosphogluconate dehydrogenase
LPLTAIAEAVFARSLSAQRAERLAAARVLAGPDSQGGTGLGDVTIEDLRDALYGAKVVAYAQGFEHVQRASDAHGWDVDLGRLAAIWRGGCIIRARFLERIRDAYADPSARPANLVLAPAFTGALAAVLPGWRRVVAAAVRAGIPVPASSSALAWYDGYRRERSPANLIQAQRDLFGAHTYQRVDPDGTFHTDWAR